MAGAHGGTPLRISVLDHLSWAPYSEWGNDRSTQQLSLLLLLRPALHWEGRSGDELSASANEIAERQIFITGHQSFQRIGGRFILTDEVDW